LGYDGRPYTLGVLMLENGGDLLPGRLAHDQRITLDGTPAETVDAETKDLAAKLLARLKAGAAKKAAPAKVKPRPTPPTNRVRATPLRRRT
jgi:hypothetical protein